MNAFDYCTGSGEVPLCLDADGMNPDEGQAQVAWSDGSVANIEESKLFIGMYPTILSSPLQRQCETAVK